MSSLVDARELHLLDGTVEDLCHELEDLEFLHALPSYRASPLRPPPALLLCVASACTWLALALGVYWISSRLVA